MAGIMPAGGIPPQDAQNALTNAAIVDGCDSLWHANRCTPRFDPASANAVISEILNVIGAAGLEYDCTLLDNLAKAVSIHEISGNGSADLDGGGAPIALLNGDNRKIGGGFIDIPNTFHRPVNVFFFSDATGQWKMSSTDATSALNIDFRFGDTADLLGQQPNMTYRPRGDKDSNVINLSFARVYTIPPGGRRIYWDARSSTSGPGDWELQYTGRALSFRVYGTSAHTRDIFTAGA